jgi:hypothetical protein
VDDSFDFGKPMLSLCVVFDLRRVMKSLFYCLELVDEIEGGGDSSLVFDNEIGGGGGSTPVGKDGGGGGRGNPVGNGGGGGGCVKLLLEL